MEIHIFEAGKPAKDRSFDLNFTLESGKIAIGGSAPCEAVIPGLPEGPQAEIHIDGGGCEIRNVGASPIAIAGRALAAGGAQALGPETLIAIGDREMVYRASASKAGGGGEGAAGGGRKQDRPSMLAKDLLKQAFSALGVPETHPALVVYDADGKVVKRLDLAPPEEEATIGRHPENRLVLYHPSVSKQHARVLRDGLGFLIKDAGSRNGLEVNGQRIQDQHRLKSGDRVRIGGFTIRFVDPKAAVEDLAQSVPDLQQVDRAAPGERVVVGAPEGGGPQNLGETASGEQKVATAAAPIPAPTPAAAAARVAAGHAPAEEAPGKTSPVLFVVIGVGVLIVIAMAILVITAVS
jgi:pSer/pThr/pTyr-binding forkhead associated (FHA) protein